MTNWNERLINWVAVSAMIEVAIDAHTKIGRRMAVIPFARIRMTVAMTFAEPRMDDQPAVKTPRKNICIPTGARAERGGYPVQPVSKPPSTSAIRSKTEAGTATQNAKA